MERDTAWERTMFRNREFRLFAIVFFLIAIITATLGFTINAAAGILIIFSCLAFGIAFLLFTKARYKRIAQISEKIDLVLHNTNYLFISELEEGELSILESEITKMTQLIEEQNSALKSEKKLLADSLADIAHQLRTPLTSANLILSLLEKTSDDHERKALLRENEELFIQMEWLINSLLKLSRLDAGIIIFQSVPVDVKSLIDTVIRPQLISIDLHNINLQIDIPAGMIIQGDASWLSEAFQNIIKNCIQSIPDSGRIEITCKDTSLYGEVTICDSGPGFAKEDIPHLFERFYRGKHESAAGYGIGLALCKMIITRHGGTITATNHPKGGALFCIRFPK